MNEQAIRNLVLVRAIETVDSKHQILSDDDLTYASSSGVELARWEAADKQIALTPALFLQKRAELLLKKIAERTPAFSRFNAPQNWLRALGIAAPGLAFFAGVFLDRIADPHRVDLLSVPLLLIILWNLVVYAILLFGRFIPAIDTPVFHSGPLGHLLNFRTFGPRKLPQTLAAALANFVTEWTQLCAPLTRARIKRIVHLCSACFAVGAVISLYVRGLSTKYEAGWESTWLDANQVNQILSFLFKPATLVFRLPGFSIADVRALQLPHSLSEGSSAQWVHLYAGTIVLLVILPRLALTLFARWKEDTLSNDFPLDLGLPYFRKLTAGIGVPAPAVLRVVPHSFTLDEARDAGLTAVAKLLLGEQARVMLRPSTPYGEESNNALVGNISEVIDEAGTVALFNLNATPEEENHGAFLDQLRRASSRQLSALIDESAYLERAGKQTGREGRLKERISLWRRFCDSHSVPLLVVNLINPHTNTVDIERGLDFSSNSK